MNTALSCLYHPQAGWEIDCALVQKKKIQMIIGSKGTIKRSAACVNLELRHLPR
jgi:hypothetical protein